MTPQGPDNARPTRSLDPILNLQVTKNQAGPSVLGEGASLTSVSSLCFVATHKHTTAPSTLDIDADGENDSSDDSDDDDELQFQCKSLVQSERRHDGDVTARAREAAASMSLAGYNLISCHINGDSCIWDLNQRRTVQEFTPNRGPGLALCRLGSATGGGVGDATASSTILYHTRNEMGTISMHDLQGSLSGEHFPIVTQFDTRCRTFCAAKGCTGNPNLLATPWQNDSVAAIWDVRVRPSNPIVLVHASGVAEEIRGNGEPSNGYGMLTSLAFSEMDNGRAVLGCGMESGTAFFHDMAMMGARQPVSSFRVQGDDPCSIRLSKDPVLAMDMVPSVLPGTSRADGSVLAIAGMAGDAAELGHLDDSEQGTIAVVKATFQDDSLNVRLRARLATCQIGDAVQGRPGVSACRFRPDGRIFAVGGWDRRLRIFDRNKSTPLAILKGHTASVSSVDWAPDAATSGLLATGAADGRVCIWKCFAS